MQRWRFSFVAVGKLEPGNCLFCVRRLLYEMSEWNEWRSVAEWNKQRNEAKRNEGECNEAE